MAHTQLSPTATPGMRYSFLAKSTGVSHKGLFTALSITAIPGMRHSFLAKGVIAPAVVETVYQVTGGGGIATIRVLKDDEEILELIIQAFAAGVFD